MPVSLTRKVAKLRRVLKVLRDNKELVLEMAIHPYPTNPDHHVEAYDKFVVSIDACKRMLITRHYQAERERAVTIARRKIINRDAGRLRRFAQRNVAALAQRPPPGAPVPLADGVLALADAADAKP